MGFLRKTVKKIGKAIKKVVKKVGKAFGKLGIVGQIGMMFLMPHLGSMWSNIGSWASNGSGLLRQAVKVIHNAGTAVGNAYQTVTQAISNGFDRAKNFMKGDGLVLSDPSKSIFAKPTDVVTDKATDVVTEEVVDTAKKEVTQPSILDKVKDEVIEEGIKGVGDLTRKKIAGTEDIDYRNTYVEVGGMSPVSSNRGVYESADLTQQRIGTNSWQEISQVYAPFISRGM